MSSQLTDPPLSDHIPSTRDMSAPSQLSVLQSLLEDAVETYKNQVGRSLIEDQLAIRLRTCDSVESVAALLEERAQTFREFLGQDRHGKIMKSIKRVVHIFHTTFNPVSGAVQVGHGIASIVRLKALMCSVFLVLDGHSIAIPTCENNICCYWYPPCRMCPPYSLGRCSCDIQVSQTIKDVIGSYNALLDLFESLGNFVQRLDIYTKMPPTRVMTETIVKIISELLSTLALATKQIEQGRLSELILADL
ncbi:hypothetical protein BJV78DRAFT_753299 [Lactifluus subvellereus]|nr:hypothetical protein BJV78DRAFT_753299 [Lactifluus subvellereus]